MESIVLIKGKVSYPITLDPGVWIFDDRKVDLSTYFNEEKIEHEDSYTKDVSQHWDRERTEGAKVPTRTNENKIRFNKDELFTKSYGIPLNPFLENAKPTNAEAIELHTSTDKVISLTIEEAKSGILGFSLNGKPLTDGPVHFYHGDGSNQNDPVRDINRIIVI
ncbi:peptidyl-prolyl cis-trans isomerase [Bacillus sp. Marseille-Q3570]|uniref:peptidyl-prolyl cis-trans isomerase n=1 Tax=Bacillus sp. Marseille-Q3570 TaxID=2963522 RepID=UPI0021B719AC|nr:peptidyl-prolyl cis-trans isomerase [Bacillus sp. Marseille-Q3570]